MSSSEEYLARLGFDTKDVDTAIDQTVSLLANLGQQFDGLSKRTDAAERSLLKGATNVREFGTGATTTAGQVDKLTQSLTSYEQVTSRVQSGNAQRSLGFNVAPISSEAISSFTQFTQGVSQANAAQAAQQARSQAASNQNRIYAQLMREQGAAERAAIGPLDAHVQAFNAYNRQVQQASQQTAIYNQYLYQQEQAQQRAAAQAARTTAAASGLNDQFSPRMRYALYDVSNAFGIAGGALLGFSTLAYATAISFQKDFANVVRTTQVSGDAAVQLQKDLIGLSQTTPISFSQITQIAALGGQLGILPAYIAAFTKSTAEFASTTGLSVEAAGTAFGRLNELLPDVNNNYDALGSSILKVGINSVATEQQIVAITTRIAGIANTAGFSADQVIGLSGALASIGVAPELSQGTITRLFTNIQLAVTQNTPALQEFARVSGTTAEQFKAQWAQNPGAGLTQLLAGINNSGGDGIRQLQSLGIVAARDIPTLLKLSQNTDLLTQSLKDARTGFADSTQLGESFGITSETVAAKLTVLQNNVTALMAALGNSAGALGGFLDGLNGLLKGITDLVSSPVGQFFALFAVGLTALVGIGLLGSAALFRLAASALAVSTATGGATGITGLYSGSLAILTGSAGRAAAAQATLAEANIAVGVSGQAASAGTAAAARSFNALRLGAIGLGLAVGLGIIDNLLKMNDAATNNKLEFTDAAKALEEYNKQVAAGSSASILNRNIIGTAGGDRGDILSKTAVGPNKVVNDITQGTKDTPLISTITSIAGQASGLSQAQESIDKIDKSMSALVANGHAIEAAEEFRKWTDSGKELGLSTDEIKAKFPAYEAAMKDTGNAAKQAADDQDALAQSVKDALASVNDAVNDTITLQNAFYSLGNSVGQTGNDFDAFSKNGRANLQNLQAVAAQVAAEAGGDAQQTVNNLQGLFNALTQSAGIPAQALSFLSAQILALGKTAVAPTYYDLSAFNQGLNDGQAALAKTGSAAKEAAEEVRTLVDYANDLKEVSSRAFDIRFGGDGAFDTINSTWNDARKTVVDANKDIADSIADTNQKVLEYEATMQGLVANNAVNRYWLTIAESYGDALRASELRAAIADTDAKIRGTAKDLADTQTKGAETVSEAQDKLNKTLVGNSDAAIANRAQITGLVGNYQDYITALASSGLSQEELSRKVAEAKEQFIAQAVQLGYSRSELTKYSAGFDDLAKAINRVPRNITVNANTDPAEQALNEFIAKAKKTAADNPVNIPYTSTFDGEAAAKSARAAAINAQISMLTQQLNRAIASGADNVAIRAQTRIDALTAQLQSGNYKSGGYTGDGGTSDIAGVVHGQEFVLNATGAKLFPRSMLDAANAGQAPAPQVVYVGQSGAGGQGTQYVEPGAQLSAYFEELIRASGVSIDGTALQNFMNAGNVNSERRRVSS